MSPEPRSLPRRRVTDDDERDPFLRFRAAHHELHCRECRVTWRSWLQRLLGVRAGFSPKVRL